MKRVAMLIQRYLPHVGGAERQLQQLAPRLRAQGFEIHVITRREPGLLPFEVIEDVPVYRMPSIGPKPVARVTFANAAVAELTRLRPDLVHAHEILAPASIAVRSKAINKHPVVLKLLRGGVRGDIFKLKLRPFWQTYFAKLKRSVDGFITISHEIDRELDSLNVDPQKRFFIPNGVDTSRYVPASEEHKQELRAELSLPPQAHIVVYAGRLVREKRVDYLLKIWDAIRAKYFDAHLLILGDGSEESRLKEMSAQLRQGGVQFAGRVDDAGSYFQAADIFVLPSSTEGLSNSMLEAMSCGLPVLATKVGGAPDVIEQNIHGCLIPPDDIDSLQWGLESLLADQSLRLSLGAAARKRILSDFSLDSIAGRLSALYYRLLESSAATG
jgi:glycosyltransferase involved in cell wall biosynthesis